MNRNLGKTLLKKKTAKGDRMKEFDRLPPYVRRLLRNADLPWSPTSVKRAYLKALRNSGNCNIAIAELDKMQSKQLSKERLYEGRDST